MPKILKFAKNREKAEQSWCFRIALSNACVRKKVAKIVKNRQKSPYLKTNSGSAPLFSHFRLFFSNFEFFLICFCLLHVRVASPSRGFVHFEKLCKTNSIFRAPKSASIRLGPLLLSLDYLSTFRQVLQLQSLCQSFHNS